MIVAKRSGVTVGARRGGEAWWRQRLACETPKFALVQLDDQLHGTPRGHEYAVIKVEILRQLLADAKQLRWLSEQQAL